MSAITLDVWEGNDTIDFVALAKEPQVVGAIVRLNSISGGHHMDAQFTTLWQKASALRARSIYFVYNPWVKGMPNYDWLMGNLPAGYNSRIFIDVEVRYPGYSTQAYANEIAQFTTMVGKRLPVTIYTGGGYVDLLTTWPAMPYWWAYYSQQFIGLQSWDAVRAAVAAGPYKPNPFNKCPGPVAMWQCSDSLILPGFGGRTVDINIWPGSEETAVTWMTEGLTPNPPPVPPVPTPTMLRSDLLAAIITVCDQHGVPK